MKILSYSLVFILFNVKFKTWIYAISMKDFYINVGKATLAHTKHISFLSDLRWGGGKEKMATGD